MFAIDEDTNVLIGKVALKQEDLKTCLTEGVDVINRMVLHPGYIMRGWTGTVWSAQPAHCQLSLSSSISLKHRAMGRMLQ
jgi:hypothetical protein